MGGAETEQTAAAVAVVQEEVVVGFIIMLTNRNKNHREIHQFLKMLINMCQMGTTRRGRQIKMPSKLKGHEVTTAGTTTARRSELFWMLLLLFLINALEFPRLCAF